MADIPVTPEEDEAFEELAERIASKVALQLARRADNRPLFSIKTLAARLDCGERTVADLLEREVIPSFIQGGKRKVDPVAVDAYLDRLRRTG